MAYIEFNPNPNGKRVGDCVVRALSKSTGNSWERTYIELCLQGFMMGDMPSANHVWGNYLKGKGYKQVLLENECENCFTVKDFCNEYFSGKYILGTGTHVVAVENGDYYDAWDSGDEVPIYYWEMKGEKNADI